jgi:sensor domain CHASE-containing protein
MNVAAEILVIILSVFLALFLILGITLMVYLINLTRQIRKVTNAAERTVGGFESLISKISKSISPIIVAETIAKYINKFKKEKGEK